MYIRRGPTYLTPAAVKIADVGTSITFHPRGPTFARVAILSGRPSWNRGGSVGENVARVEAL